MRACMHACMGIGSDHIRSDRIESTELRDGACTDRICCKISHRITEKHCKQSGHVSHEETLTSSKREPTLAVTSNIPVPCDVPFPAIIFFFFLESITGSKRQLCNSVATEARERWILKESQRFSGGRTRL